MQDIFGRTVNVSEAALHDVVRRIADPAVRSRKGFGAFRKFGKIYEQTLSLASSSVNFSGPVASLWTGLRDDPSLLPHARYQFGLPRHQDFFREILGDAHTYDPPCLWSLFWALARAQHRFLRVFGETAASHEERLTGHLLAQVLERVEEFGPLWAGLGSDGRGGAIAPLDLSYADISSGGKESQTGADFGLIVHASFHAEGEFFKSVRFQAKKTTYTGAANISISQMKTLAKRPNIGYYLFYHASDSDGWQLTPTVVPAGRVQSRIEEAQGSDAAETAVLREIDDIVTGEKRRTFHAREEGFDFATFVSFGVADPVSDYGVPAEDAESAARVLFDPAALPPPSRLAVITLGIPEEPVAWSEVLRRVAPPWDGERSF